MRVVLVGSANDAEQANANMIIGTARAIGWPAPCWMRRGLYSANEPLLFFACEVHSSTHTHTQSIVRQEVASLHDHAVAMASRADHDLD